jgi:hypothetical protein
MDLKDIFDLGSTCQYLRLSESTLPSVKGEGYLLSTIVKLSENLKQYNLCEDRIERIENQIKKLEKYDKEQKILKTDAEKLSKHIEFLMSHLIKELSQRNVYELTVKRGLDAGELIKLSNKEASEYFLTENWDKLTAIEKSDYSDAAKCLLLESATPSVMVALRGGEASIKNYYKLITGIEAGEKTWRQITRELKKDAEKYDIRDTFISFLDYLGDAKRNFAQHPNKIYTIREAAVVFMQMVAMVEDIYTYI